MQDFGPTESECLAPYVRFLRKESVFKDRLEELVISPLEKEVRQNTTVLHKITILRLFECVCPCDSVVVTRSEGSRVTDWSDWEYWGILWRKRRHHIDWVDREYACDDDGVVN